MKPWLLDLFCGAGGATKGYQEAGFFVVGVDCTHQRRYCGDVFVQADALDYLDRLGRGLFAAVHASPPCQAFTDLQRQSKLDYPDYIAATRARLEALALPYVIENVDRAPLVNPILLCGTMFPPLRVIRHRLFESNVPLTAPPHPEHPLVFTHDKRKSHYGKLDQASAFVQVTGGGNCTRDNARSAMGIDWMTKRELNEAIPPAYTRYVGAQLL